MREKVLYLLHTDWHWIKQRSQFIAEELHELAVDLRVCYKLSPRRAHLVRNRTKARVFPAPFLPFSLRTQRWLRLIDIAIWKIFLTLYVRLHGITHVIVTHPLLADYLPGVGAAVIYDCHDDNAEFYEPGRLRNIIEESHSRIVETSNLNVFSSHHLRKKFGGVTPSIVVRNGHSIQHDTLGRSPDRRNGADPFTIFYFGTISEWFDFDLMLELLEAFPVLRLTMIGPADVPVRQHPRIAYTSAMPHGELIRYAQQADGFVMPFKVNPLIEGVDPVKLYEYLAYRVPVLSVYYPELEHFSGLVDFYTCSQQAKDAVASYISARGGEIDVDARAAFLAGSTWRARANQYVEAINRV